MAFSGLLSSSKPLFKNRTPSIISLVMGQL
jgi:hypothetical protein